LGWPGTGLAVADVNNDGAPDIIAAAGTAGEFFNGNGTFQSAQKPWTTSANRLGCLGKDVNEAIIIPDMVTGLG